MKRRKTVSGEFFSTIAAILVAGLVLMCCVQTALSASYFARERRDSLTAVLDGATALSQKVAEDEHVMSQMFANQTIIEETRSGFEMFRTASGARIFAADSTGSILIHTGQESFTGSPIPASVMAELDTGADIFERGDLGGVYNGKYYTAGRRINIGDTTVYLFAATPMDGLTDYVGDTLTIFVLSGGAMIILCTLFTTVLAKRVTGPIEDISEAARRLGSGDFTARAPVTGCVELADFATTFNNMAARLQTIDNSRGQFMGNIAHELRTPMTTIKGFIDGIVDGTIPQEQTEHYLTIVSQETGRLARLVQNMLDITKLEAGEVPVRARVYDVWETITDVVLSDEARIEKGRIDIEGLDVNHMMVYADPDFVHQVVYNIVDNAIKFTPAGGVIRFAAVKKGDMVEISIENTGAGIAPEALPFVFERFYKEDRSRGVNARGSGLGLHICKVLVGLSGGQIHAESEQGEWCRFVFTLPAGEGK